jgi:hypothetical protein
MKKLLTAALFAAGLLACPASTTINDPHAYAYAANLGWVNGRSDINNGAVIGEYVCSGSLYGANVGWISLGSGTPTNGIQYHNLSANDFGVNNDGEGNLRGYVYGANIGWLNFEDTGAPKVDLFTGKFSGSVWSANCGWISLSNAVAYVQTDTIQSSPLAPNGLPMAWLIANFHTINVLATADPDGDGQSNAQEYLADTNPNDAADVLRITSYQRNVLVLDNNILAWNSRPTRYYAVQYRTNLTVGVWTEFANFSAPGVGGTGFLDSNPQNFYRIRVYRPLQP